MLELIKGYISNLSINDVDEFAKNNDIYLNNNELAFVYSFIKKNYEAILINPDMDLSKYKKMFKQENYDKIISLLNYYRKKYAKFLP